MEKGRPTKYKEEYNEQAFKLCLLGATDSQMADFFDVSESTLNLWKLEYPIFSESIKRGKIESDIEIADSLRKLALGFHYEEESETVGDNGRSSTVTKRYNSPDFRAIRFWLMNRRPENWRDKQEIDHTTQGEKIGAVSVEIIHTTKDSSD